MDLWFALALLVYLVIGVVVFYILANIVAAIVIFFVSRKAKREVKNTRDRIRNRRGGLGL